MRPTGAARFCACSAPTTWPMPIPACCSASGRNSTVNSRCTPPASRTSATPAMARNSRVISGSITRVSSGPANTFDATTIDRMG